MFKLNRHKYSWWCFYWIWNSYIKPPLTSMTAAIWLRTVNKVKSSGPARKTHNVHSTKNPRGFYVNHMKSRCCICRMVYFGNRLDNGGLQWSHGTLRVLIGFSFNDTWYAIVHKIWTRRCRCSNVRNNSLLIVINLGLLWLSRRCWVSGWDYLAKPFWRGRFGASHCGSVSFSYS